MMFSERAGDLPSAQFIPGLTPRRKARTLRNFRHSGMRAKHADPESSSELDLWIPGSREERAPE
jgi:hypothetical protein